MTIIQISEQEYQALKSMEEDLRMPISQKSPLGILKINNEHCAVFFTKLLESLNQTDYFVEVDVRYRFENSSEVEKFVNTIEEDVGIKPSIL